MNILRNTLEYAYLSVLYDCLITISHLLVLRECAPIPVGKKAKWAARNSG